MYMYLYEHFDMAYRNTLLTRGTICFPEVRMTFLGDLLKERETTQRNFERVAAI